MFQKLKWIISGKGPSENWIAEDTPALLNELFEKIEVYSIEGKGKNRTQKIIIHYRFFGVIEKPVKEENVVLEARQGVAVEYLTA